MRNLVTGGAGFLGSHLIDKLMNAEEEILCLDNYFTGRKTNIAQWIGHPRFELIRHDVPSLFNWKWIVFASCLPSFWCITSSIRLKQVSQHLQHTGFGATGWRSTTAGSTSEVYGDPEVHPQPESYRGSVNTTGIRSCYDEGKRIAETLCFDYQRMHNTEVRIIRIFNTYGPRMLPDDGRVVSNFIVQALKGQPLTLQGDGKQTRSFCYVSDLIEGMIGPWKEAAGPINIGNPEEWY